MNGEAVSLSTGTRKKSEQVEINLPFHFLPLDQLHTVTGFSDLDQSGFWSNETESTRDDFTVRTKRGIKYVGPYKNEQNIAQLPTGARYAKSVYVAHKEGGSWLLSNLKLSGAALTAWIELSGKHNLEGGKVSLTGSTEGKKGATVYHIPTFEYDTSTTEEDDVAFKLDQDLQLYLKQYLSAPKYDDNAEPVSEPGKATPEQIEEFNRLKAAKTQLKAADFPDDDGMSEEDVQRFFDDGEPLPDVPPEYQ